MFMLKQSGGLNHLFLKIFYPQYLRFLDISMFILTWTHRVPTEQGLTVLVNHKEFTRHGVCHHEALQFMP
jgi:hypothetical protein